jgi:hypothetical protein
MTLDYAMTQSVAFRTLPGPAVKVLIELRGRYNGSNNGHLRLSFLEAKRLLEMGQGTIERAFRTLQERGFIKLRKPGDWYGRLAAEWEITALPMDGKIPSRDWNHWNPPAATAAQAQKQKSYPPQVRVAATIVPAAVPSRRR